MMQKYMHMQNVHHALKFNQSMNIHLHSIYIRQNTEHCTYFVFFFL